VDVAIQAFSTTTIYALTLAITAWTAGALYYDVGRESKFSWLFIFAWATFVVTVYTMWQTPWKAFAIVLTIFGLFLIWWFSQKPSNERNWQPNAAILAQAIIDGDSVTIENVRNTEYRSLEDYTPRHEIRTYPLSQLQGLDTLVCHWGSPWVSHPIFVFDFGLHGRICISIEVRYRIGQKYNLLRSLYRQQEIIYVVCDERDAILRRTKYATQEDVYLYRVEASKDEIKEVFLEYCERINNLVDSPRWYNGVTTNCTTSIYTQRKNHMVWDWRLLFNGRLDQMLYDRKRLDQSRPFKILKQQSRVNDIANRASFNDFGDSIRSQLAGYNRGNLHELPSIGKGNRESNP